MLALIILLLLNSIINLGSLYFAVTNISNKNKKIEEIKVGDKVWSHDEKTGKKALKEVTKLFVNKTRKWIHLVFYNHEGALEKITCTEGHPFFVKDVGWVMAIDLVENDIVTTIDNSQIIVNSKIIEILDNDDNTYNFEVKDYHTYYVGDASVLVHNKCIFEELGVKNYSEVSSKYTPDEFVDKLDELGFSKEVSFKSTNSGPSTIMRKGDLTFRIQASPSNGSAYFRVMNSSGNYLGASGNVISDVNKQVFRELTHFYL